MEEGREEKIRGERYKESIRERAYEEEEHVRGGRAYEEEGHTRTKGM